MSMIDRSLDGMALLSGQLGAVLRRRLREFGGIALLSLAMMAASALATWSVHDPSLSHATDAPRAQSARPARCDRRRSDDAVAGPGLAGAAPAGRRLGLSPARSSAARPRAAARRCSGCSAPCSPRRSRRACRAAAHWPLPSGLGGVVGDAILRAPAVLLGTPLVGIYRLVAAIVLGTGRALSPSPALPALSGAARRTMRQTKTKTTTDEPRKKTMRAWVSLGRLMHAV